jgi:hypothetical protein
LVLLVCSKGYSNSAATNVTSKQDALYCHLAVISSSPVQTPEEGKCEHATNEDIFGLAIARRDRTVGNFFGGISNLPGTEYAVRR